MNSTLKLGVLDFGTRTSNQNSLTKVQDVIEYAILADELGFSRFWISEHYRGDPRTAWTNPVPLVPLLAAYTQRIRIGTAGIILKLHNPFHIAGNFKLFDNIFHKRIDLGVVNGGAYSAQVAKYTYAGNSSFELLYRKMLHYLRDEKALFSNDNNRVVLPPYGGSIPEIWSMSTSTKGFARALTLKTNFSRSIFHENSQQEPQRDELEKFREEFFRSVWNDAYGNSSGFWLLPEE